MQITPTLNFGGKCREAIQMYEKAFGGKITCLITYREANDPAYMPRLTEEQKDYIYHAELDARQSENHMSDHTDIEFSFAIQTFSRLYMTQRKKYSVHTKS